MTGMLELSDQEFKTTLSNVLSTVRDTVGHTQEWMGNVRRVMTILRKRENHWNKMGNDYDEFISRLDMAE